MATFQNTNKLGHAYMNKKNQRTFIIFHWDQIKNDSSLLSQLTMIKIDPSILTDDDRFIIILCENAQPIAFVMRVYMNLATIMFVSHNSSKNIIDDVNDICEYFVDTLRDLNKPLDVINEINFKIFFYLPPLQSKPLIFSDLPTKTTTIFGVNIATGLVGYRCRLLLDSNFSIKPIPVKQSTTLNPFGQTPTPSPFGQTSTQSPFRQFGSSQLSTPGFTWPLPK